MVTNNPAVVCPKCRQVNCYEIKRLEMVDTDLHVSYLCETCSTEYTDIFALVYLGGHMPNKSYDRDNITAAPTTVEQTNEQKFNLICVRQIKLNKMISNTKDINNIGSA